MLEEIGSEFWHIELCEKSKIKSSNNQVFMLSGRTALDFIIKDLKSERELNSVYLPSYCCESMIKPFAEKGVGVIFYDVIIDNNGGLKLNVDLSKKFDAIFLIQYFGYEDKNIKDIAKICSIKNIVVIEDTTHSFFMDNAFSEYTDYVFASLRKWTGIYTGGTFIKNCGKLTMNRPKVTNELYYNLRKRAIKSKSDYMEKLTDTKEEFLRLFNESENVLEEDYKEYLMDEESVKRFQRIDIELLKQRRQYNAEYLLRAISKVSFITPIFNKVSYREAPMFVPVIIKKGMRDRFRKHLIENNIYCPIHWQISDLHDISYEGKEIYCNILSLVCDQRYGEEEMKYFIEVINKFKE